MSSTQSFVWAEKKRSETRERESLDTLGRDAQAINHLPLNDCAPDETCESAAALTISDEIIENSPNLLRLCLIGHGMR